MIVIIRTKEDGEALSKMSEEYRIGSKLSVVNTTEHNFPFKVGDDNWICLHPFHNREIEYEY